MPVKAVRRRVLQHDLDMYAAISGRRPALLPEPPPAKSTALASLNGSWSPLVLCAYLRQMYQRRVALHVHRPDLPEFFRKLSGQASDRLREAQSRVAAAGERKARDAKRMDRDSVN
jgi:hypothetical protein